MRLLLDQNLSRRLLASISETFPGSAHVASLGLSAASDQEIWEYACRQGYTILSKDADFHHISFLHGAPPKIVWVRLGNCSTMQIAECVLRNTELIASFLADPEASLLVLD